MNDQLERDIRNLFCNTGELSRDEVTSILLGLLERIQHLEQLRPAQEPLFWYRPVGEDGGYEGPLHNGVIEKVRKECGAWKPLYTTPPQRKPLSDEEIYKASTEAGMQEHYMGFHSGFIRFARAIEAALKAKNT